VQSVKGPHRSGITLGMAPRAIGLTRAATQGVTMPPFTFSVSPET
jgi:hypothetical protein